jgi:hypothetical protein
MSNHATEDFDADAALLWDEYKAEQADWTTDEDAEADAQLAWEESTRMHDDFVDSMEYWNPIEQGMYDDDPNPYHGDYSEM